MLTPGRWAKDSLRAIRDESGELPFRPHLCGPRVQEGTGAQKLVILNGVRGVKDLATHLKTYKCSRALSKQTTSLFHGVKRMLAPSARAFIGVAPVRLREVLRFEDCAQDDKTGAPFRIQTPVAELVGNGKAASPHSKTLARRSTPHPRGDPVSVVAFGANQIPGVCRASLFPPAYSAEGIFAASCALGRELTESIMTSLYVIPPGIIGRTCSA